MNQYKIILLFSFLFIGCVSNSKYDTLKQTCDETEQKLQEELKAEKEKSIKLEDDKNKEIANLKEAQSKELQAKQDKYNELLKEKIFLRSSIAQMEGSVDDLSQEKDALAKQRDEMTRALEDLKKRKEESEARVTEFKSLLDKFKTFIDTGKLKIKMIDGRMVIVLPSDVLFASGSKDLSSNGKKAITEVTSILTEIENRKFQIEGHTDSDRYRVYGQTNWDLAADRAINVLYTMIKAGLPESKISAASFGDSRPIAPNDTNANKALNRRIEIVVVPDLSLLPGYEELKKMADTNGSQQNKISKQN